MKPRSLHAHALTPGKNLLTALSLAGLALSTASASISIDYVPVANAGNPNDTTGYGVVSYAYNIGKYEVTLTQYTAFLNAVAATDTNSLYNTSMGTNLNIAGITRSGSPGSYTYAVAGDGNRPVTYVSMPDAMRFANWVGNGQGVGAQDSTTTENGAYTMSLGGLAPRNGGATVVVTSENEWYKAAYYDPTKGGSNYWLYPTRSDTAPGNVIGAGANQANYNNGVFSVTQNGGLVGTQNYLTAGGDYSNSAGHYGTFDQAGNVWEWNEAVISGSNRGLRGGSWDFSSTSLQSSNRDDGDPTIENSVIGFRLAAVPEPGSTLMGLACIGAAVLRRRRR